MPKQLFEKGHAPTGRPKGSLGRRGRMAAQIASDMGVEPLAAILKIAKNPKMPFPTRYDAYKFASQFLYPKLSSLAADLRTETTHTVIAMERIRLDPALSFMAETLAIELAKPPMLELEAPAVTERTGV